MKMGLSRRELAALLGGGTALAALLPLDLQAQVKAGVLRVSARANPSSLDPMTGLAGDDTPFLWTLYATLMEFEFETLQPKPGLAESWSYPDPNTFQIRLRPGLLFHDGTVLDAEAVKFNIERSRSDPRSTIRTDFNSVDSVETKGDLDVIIRLKQPDAALPLALTSRAGMMVSPTAAKSLGDKLVRNPVGAGPWSFVSWADNASVVVKRAETFWKKDAIKLDGIEFVIVPELNTGLRSVIAGQNHFVYKLSPQQKPVIDRARVEGIIGPTLYFHLVYFNNSRPPFNDVRVRQAFSYAVDRESFNKATMLSLGEIAQSAVPKSHWAHDATLGGLFKHDPDKARALLKEAGHGAGLDVPTIGWNDQYSQQKHEVLIEQLSKVGIRLKVDRYAIADASTLFLGPEKKGEAMISAWTGRPDPIMTYNLLTSPKGFFNPSQLQDTPGLAEALMAAQSTLEPEARKAALAKVQRLVAESVWFCPLVFEPELDAGAKAVRGFKTNLLGWPKFEDVSVAA